MKRMVVLICALLSTGAAYAQDASGPITEKDIFQHRPTPHRVQPAPQSGSILIPFGDYARVYFRHPVKSLKLADGLTVRATPESDHIIRFDALSPGETSLTLEDSTGTESRLAIITVTGEPHVVGIYDRRGYTSVVCNELRCGPTQTIKKKEKDKEED